MAYTKQGFVDYTTVLTAANLIAMEDGIIANQNSITQLSSVDATLQENIDEVSEDVNDLYHVEESINLYNTNSSDNVPNTFVHKNNGFISVSGYIASHLIPVTPGATYYITYQADITADYVAAYYNSSETLVTSTAPTLTSSGSWWISTAPSGAAYMRVSTDIYKTVKLMVVKSDTEPDTTYVAYSKSESGVVYTQGVKIDQMMDEQVMLAGKVLALNGDSICYGADGNGGYGAIIGSQCGMTVQNVSESGATIAAETYSDGTAKHWICRTITEMNADADFVVLEGGVNDSAIGVPMGELNLSNYTAELDDTTFCGAFESMLKQAIVHFTKAKIFYLAVHKMTSKYSSNDSYDSYYHNALALCKKWGIPVIDLNIGVPPLGMYVEDEDLITLRETYTSNGDGWHPNEAGYKRFYVDAIISAMKHGVSTAAPTKDDVDVDEVVKNTIDRLTSPFSTTANIVQCNPVEGYPLGVTVNLEPIQSGSGDPYPAGGGKNLLRPEWVDGNTAGVATGLRVSCKYTIPIVAGKTYTLSANNYTDYMYVINTDATQSTYPFWHDNDEPGTQFAECGNEAEWVQQPITFTATANGYMAVVVRKLDESTITIAEVEKLKIQLELGSTATDYAPYSNIRPITGHTDCEVVRCGKNLLKLRDGLASSSAVESISDDGKITIKGSLSAAWYRIGEFDIVAGKTYNISGILGYGRIGLSKSNTLQPAGTTHPDITSVLGSALILLGNNVKVNTFTANESATSVYVWYCSDSNNTGSNAPFTMALQLELSSTATDYEPYTANTYTTEYGQTVYGGTHRVNEGEVDETWAELTFDGTEEWRASTSVQHSFYTGSNLIPELADMYIDATYANIYLACSHFKPVIYSSNQINSSCGIYQGTTGQSIRFMDSRLSTVDEWTAYLAAQYAAGTPVQIAYKLASPNAITTTAHDIPALDGMNTVYADAGDVTVNGRIDPDYINNNMLDRIAALEAAIISNT